LPSLPVGSVVTPTEISGASPPKFLVGLATGVSAFVRLMRIQDVPGYLDELRTHLGVREEPAPAHLGTLRGPAPAAGSAAGPVAQGLGVDLRAIAFEV
jgi:hypothetical protein